MRFSGVLFDAGDILYDATPWRRWLAAEITRLGRAMTYPDLVETWEALLVDVYTGRADYWDRFDRLVADAGVPEAERESLRCAARDKGQEVQVVRRPSEGAAESLRALKEAGLKLGVLSDTEASADRVREGLERLGLAAPFDAIVTSRDIGFVKPSPQAFDAAVRAIGVPLTDCAFVAHDVDELEGAQAVGLFAIGYHPHPDAPTDLTVETFADLTHFLLNS